MTQNCLNDTRNSKIDKTSFFWEKKLLKEIKTKSKFAMYL